MNARLSMLDSLPPKLSVEDFFCHFCMTGSRSRLSLLSLSLAVSQLNQTPLLQWFVKYMQNLTIVDRLSAGAAPSNTKTGLIPWKRSLLILRKKPKTWALIKVLPSLSFIVA